MAKYTVIFGHLNRTYIKRGDKLKKGSRVAEMGNTGGSYGNHLHLGVLAQERTKPWYVDEYIFKGLQCDEKQTYRFYIDGLFTYGGKPKKAYISGTNDFWDVRVWQGHKYYHNGLDLVTDNSAGYAPQSGHIPDIWWPIAEEGIVVAVGDDRNETSTGYGIYVMVQYEITSKVIKTGTVNLSVGVNIREKPDFTSKKVGWIAKGTKVKILEEVRDGYYMLWYRTDKGYIKAEFIK